MNQDDDVTDQKEPAASAEHQANAKVIDFVGTINARELGYTKRNSFTKPQIKATAENELVKKQFTEMHCELPGGSRSTFLMEFSPDGTKVASTHGNHQIHVMDVRTGKHIKTLVGHPRTPWCIAFHPTSNQIIASGCLGGQVRIWDLSGGSEVWTAEIPSVIASIAFHPDDRLLVIATCNELYFWDWSKPQPFMHVSTATIKEKVRYVAFDKLGHKLITGITNTPQTRWERVRAVPISVSVPRSEGGPPLPPTLCVGLSNIARRFSLQPRPTMSALTNQATTAMAANRRLGEASVVPERERRITNCYRELVHQYEVLVHRYLQIYRRPIMIDQGTDPMEVEAAPSTSNNRPRPDSPVPSTSGLQRRKSSATLLAKRSTSTSTQSQDNQPGPSTSGTHAKPGNTGKKLRKRPILFLSDDDENDNEDDDDDDDPDEDSNDNASNVAKYSKVRQLNLNLNTSATTGMATSQSAQEQVQEVGTESPPATEEDLKYKMRIKCFLMAKKVEAATLQSATTNTSSPASPPPATANANTSTTGTSTETAANMTRKDNIKNMINNAKLMLARYRETLQQRGLRTGDLPEFLPSASLTQPGASNAKPSTSTGTNTSEGDTSTAAQAQAAPPTPAQGPLPKRKRRLLRPNLLGNILFTSSEDDSSDGEAPPRTSLKTKAEPAVNPLQPKRRRRLLLPHELQNLVETNRESESERDDRNSTLMLDRQVQRLVVESLEMLDPETPPRATETTPMAPSNDSEERICGACGGTEVPSTAPSATTPPSERARRRFPSHRLSAFHPTRLVSYFPNLRPSSSSSANESPAQDEVINYAERDGEPEPEHPTVPPPPLPPQRESSLSEFTSSVESTIGGAGIGNMYSNIVHELESSLNDVRNIRFRLGEMTDMLSNFSDRLENIMTQSNSILRNLSTSLDELPVVDEVAVPPPDPRERDLFEDELLQSYRNPFGTSGAPGTNAVNSDHTYPLNPDMSDADARRSSLSPLHLSLQLTVTHIQRQARLLREQVEAIERIDRAMIEVAQLQTMRQMFDELHAHFGSTTSSTASSGVTSVRQMMAGTRISDTESPTDEASTSTSRSEEPHAPSGATARARKNFPRCLFLMHRQYRRGGSAPGHGGAAASLNARRNAAKDRVLLRRNIYRRFLPSRTTNRATIDLSGMRSRGYYNLFNPGTLPTMTRRLEHYLMEHSRYIGRSVPSTSAGGSTSWTSGTRSDFGEHVITLRLNNCRQRMNRLMGSTQSQTLNRYNNVTADGTTRFAARQALSYTLDNITRFVEMNPTLITNPHANTSSTFRSQVWEVIELSLLLSELLLLQIVDSIPPPSGINLDPERESLSMRIDQMCIRMIQSRLMGQSSQLTRSLRLMRLTVRYATQALGQTYTARRNAMLPVHNNQEGNERADSRQGLLDDIHNCLRNIRRYRELANDGGGDAPHATHSNSHIGEWYRTINDLIGRYTSDAPSTSDSSNGGSGASSSATNTDNQRFLNNETGEEMRPPPAVTVEDANTSDEDEDDVNDNVNNNTLPPRHRRVGYHFNERFSDDDDHETAEESPWRSERLPSVVNVPMVHINDEPLTNQPQTGPPSQSWRGPSYRNPPATRQILSERLDDLRTERLLRPRFLHPLYSGVVNPFAFEDNLDEAHREVIYDSDVIPTVTPNHRIQVWEFGHGIIPNISNPQKNLVVNECKIHNDASVDYASDGSILVTLLPSGGYMNVTNRLGVYSLEWQTLGQCLYVTSFEQTAVSVSLSPTNRHLVVGLASRRIFLLPSDTWTMARIFLLDYRKTTHGNLAPIRELEQNRDTNYMSVNCIRWLPTAGQGLIFGTNTGHLRLLT